MHFVRQHSTFYFRYLGLYLFVQAESEVQKEWTLEVVFDILVHETTADREYDRVHENLKTYTKCSIEPYSNVHYI